MPIWLFPPAPTPSTTPSSEDSDNVVTGPIDHVVEASNRLCEQFKRKPRILGFLSAYVTGFQDLETAMQDVLTKRGIDTAEGAQLDAIGFIVVESRDGADDDEYRRRIRARVRTNRSSGVVDDLLTITRLIVYDEDAAIRAGREDHATMWIRIEGVSLDDELAAVLFKFLSAARSGGVRLRLEWTTDEDHTFTFTVDDTEVDDRDHGFSDAIVFAVTGDFVVEDDNDSSIVAIPAGTYEPEELEAIITAAFVADGVDDTWTFEIVDGFATFRSSAGLDLSITFDETGTRNILGFTGDVSAGPGETITAPNRCCGGDAVWSGTLAA